MKRADSIGIGISVVLLVLSVAVFVYALNRNVNVSQPKAGEAVSYQYIIRDFNGNIAVFEEGSEQPKEIYEVPIEILPEEDVKKLKEGIYVQSKEQMERLIEELTS